MSVNSNVPKPQYQDSLRSKVVRVALEEHDAAVNDLQSQINIISTAASGNETVNARDSFDVLRDRLRSAYKGLSNVVITGGTVEAQDTPDLTMKVGSLTAVVDGVGINLGVDRAWSRTSTTVTITEASHTLSNTDTIYVEQSSDNNTIPITDYTVSNVTTDTFDITGVDTGDTSGTITFGRDTGAVTAPTNEQYAAVTVSSDATISIILSSDLADAILPAMAITNRPLSINLLISSTTSITDSDIVDAKGQGCLLIDTIDTIKWFWKIQDAIDAMDNTNGGHITVNAGNYYEEVDFLDNNNTVVEFRGGATVYRADDSSYCIRSINTVANETTGNRIIGGVLNANGKAGTNEMVLFEYTDQFHIDGLNIGTNTGSSATNEAALFDNCDNFHVTANLESPAEISVTTSTLYSIDTSGKFLFFRTFVDMATTDETSRIQVPAAVNAELIGASDYDGLFDALDAYIPNTNDEIVLNGGFTVSAAAIYIGLKAVRTAATTMDVYTFQIWNGATHTGAQSTIGITNGNATAIVASLNW